MESSLFDGACSARPLVWRSRWSLRFIFGELVSVGDLIVASGGDRRDDGGTVWLHLIAAEGDWRPTRWAAPAGLEFVGGALMWGNGFGSIPFGVVGGLLQWGFRGLVRGAGGHATAERPVLIRQGRNRFDPTLRG
jgi:hypothetical protein